MKRWIITTLLLPLMVACMGERRGADTEAAEATIYVSIHPLKGLVEELAEEGTAVKVLVPAGASPESFEPTPRQLIELEQAELVVGIGLLDFEQNLLHKLGERCRIATLAEGITLLKGSCAHHHASCGHHHHDHGIDPHIWTSPRELRQMSRNLYEVLQPLVADTALLQARFTAQQERLAGLDKRVEEALTEAAVERFMIHHPAMSYYARAYGLEQVAVEHEGKEPSARRLGQLIEEGRAQGIERIFYQVQSPRSTVEALARDLRAIPTPFDPLTTEIEEEIERFTALLCGTINPETEE